MQGRIIKQISNDYTVFAHDKTYVCKCRVIFRKEGIEKDTAEPAEARAGSRSVHIRPPPLRICQRSLTR